MIICPENNQESSLLLSFFFFSLSFSLPDLRKHLLREMPPNPGRDPTPPVMPDNHRLGDPQLVHQRHHMPSHSLGRVVRVGVARAIRRLRLGRGPVAQQIDRDHAVALPLRAMLRGQEPDLVPPPEPQVREAVHEHDGEAEGVALFNIIWKKKLVRSIRMDNSGAKTAVGFFRACLCVCLVCVCRWDGGGLMQLNHVKKKSNKKGKQTHLRY